MSRVLGASAPLFAGLLALALLSAGCAGGDSADQGRGGGIVVVLSTPTPTVGSTPTVVPSPTPTPTPTPEPICSPNPDPAPPAKLQVQEPQPRQQLRVPVHVRGWGSNIGYQEIGLAVAVVNTSRGVVQALDVPPQPRTYRIPPPGLEITEFTRPFAADIALTGLTGPTPFCIWVYLETTPEGQPRGVAQVPVIIAP